MSAPPQKRKFGKSDDEDDEFPHKRPRQTTSMEIDDNERSTSSDENSMTPEDEENSNSAVKTSQYDSVFWFEKDSKWIAQLTHRKKAYYIGSFNSEEEAAIAVNEKCQEMNMPLKNPDVKMPATTQGKQTSQYSGVSWDKREQKWLARFTYKGKPHFVGYFHNEIEAARAINGRCQYLNIPLKNKNVPPVSPPSVAGYKQVATFVSGKPSKFKNVYWEQESKTWHAKLVHQGNSLNLGNFRSEIDAAISVNHKCEQLGSNTILLHRM
jgi:hypothetical protein